MAVRTVPKTSTVWNSSKLVLTSLEDLVKRGEPARVHGIRKNVPLDCSGPGSLRPPRGPMPRKSSKGRAILESELGDHMPFTGVVSYAELVEGAKGLGRNPISIQGDSVIWLSACFGTMESLVFFLTVLVYGYKRVFCNYKTVGQLKIFKSCWFLRANYWSNYSSSSLGVRSRPDINDRLFGSRELIFVCLEHRHRDKLSADHQLVCPTSKMQE